MTTWPGEDQRGAASRHVRAGPRDLGMLLRRVAVNDESAFSGLYEATVARVYGLAIRVVRSPSAAAQVAQESYAEIWRTAADFDSERSSPLAWMLAVVHTRAVRQLRSVDHVPECGQDSAELFDERNPLAGLPFEEREVLDLAYFQGRTRQEVAALTAVPVSVVDARLHAGLVRLRDLMKGR